MPVLRDPPMHDTGHYTAGELLHSSLDVALSRTCQPVVLAVSGGSDSMALLFAMHRWARSSIAAVATFDHGTGSYAADAAALVAAQGRRLGLTVIRERSMMTGSSEAEWRAARWSFLRRVAGAFRAPVATAHTRDDQVETVVMRLLRGSGTRGLAALAAPGPIVRPWLGVSRAELRQWVESEGIPFLDDPMNESRRFARVRVRLDIVPALEAASPGFRESMLEIADRAAKWRRDVDEFLDTEGLAVDRDNRSVTIPAEVIRKTTDEGRAVIWPALCSRIGVTLDAKGTREAVKFSTNKRIGARIQVAGGAVLQLRRSGADHVFEALASRVGGLWSTWSGNSRWIPDELGGWRFIRIQAGEAGESPWECALPEGVTVAVRPWEAGDRIRGVGAGAPRRVTRYFTESRVPVSDRPSWPVVQIGNELVWVPGVCRAVATPLRSGGPDPIWYRCERKFD